MASISPLESTAFAGTSVWPGKQIIEAREAEAHVENSRASGPKTKQSDDIPYVGCQTEIIQMFHIGHTYISTQSSELWIMAIFKS
jgi:hypothetical protein